MTTPVKRGKTPLNERTCWLWVVVTCNALGEDPTPSLSILVVYPDLNPVNEFFPLKNCQKYQTPWCHWQSTGPAENNYHLSLVQIKKKKTK